MLKSKKSFTLIELIIVVIIIAILAVAAIPKYFANLEKSRKTAAVNILTEIRRVERAYFTVKGTYTYSFPIKVDFEGDGIDDIILEEPKSTDFKYWILMIPGWIIRAIPLKTGLKEYWMDIETGVVTLKD